MLISDGGFALRGEGHRSEGLFSYIRLEERIAADHPLRAIRALVDETLAALSSQNAYGGFSVTPE